MHRCQGFGELTKRGENIDYFDFIKGEKPKTEDLFEGINTTWTRVAGGEKIGTLLAEIDRNYRSDNPAASIPDLLKALKMIDALPDGHWKSIKAADIRNVIKGCMGLYLEAVADNTTGTPGAPAMLSLEAIQRGNVQLTLTGIAIAPGLFDTTMTFTLANNADWVYAKKIVVPKDAPFTSPFWLQLPGSAVGCTSSRFSLILKRTGPKIPTLKKSRWMAIPFRTEMAMGNSISTRITAGLLKHVPMTCYHK